MIASPTGTIQLPAWSQRFASSQVVSPTPVNFVLSTTLVIPDYHRFYNSPIQSFHPQYFDLADGSLLTTAFMEDLKDANLSLLMTGMFTMLAARNILVSGDYIRRGHMKRKGLFYILCLSQLLASATFIPKIVPFFDSDPHCHLAVAVSYSANFLSLALMITGILGIKAYRCLSNARFVLVFVGLLRAASCALFALDVRDASTERTLIGICTRTGVSKFAPIFVALQLVESVFLGCCFLYAVWKSRSKSGNRGRISLHPSLHDAPLRRQGKHESSPRGWWDYVPQDDALPVSPTRPKTSSFLHNVQFQIYGLQNSDVPLPSVPPRKSSLRVVEGNHIRKPVIRTTLKAFEALERPSDEHEHENALNTESSEMSHISKLIPRMALFREVVRDELHIVVAITVSFIVTTVMAVLALDLRNRVSLSIWLEMNWAIVSILSVHSSGRVIRRHEQEAILQHPATWDQVARADHAMAEIWRQEGTRRRAWSPVRVSARPPFYSNHNSEDGVEFINPWNSGNRPISSQPAAASLGSSGYPATETSSANRSTSSV